MTTFPAAYHPPAWTYEYVATAARSLADHCLPFDEVEDAVHIVSDGSPSEGRGDRVSLYIHVAQLYYDQRLAQINVVSARVRRAVWPLFEQKASKAAIEAEARRAGADEIPRELVIQIFRSQIARLRPRKRR